MSLYWQAHTQGEGGGGGGGGAGDQGVQFSPPPEGVLSVVWLMFKVFLIANIYGKSLQQ